MKKFLCVVISALLVLTSSSFVALAKKDENVTKKENAQIEVRDESKKDNFSDKKAEKDKNEKEKEKQEKTEKESIEEKKPHDKKSDDKKTDEVKTDKQKDEKGKEKADKKVHKTKEQKREEIKKAVNEAERFAGEDKKRKDEVEARNHADGLVYSTEKTLKELGEKVSADDKHKIEAALEDLKKTLEGTDISMIKTASEKLTDISYEVFGKIYQQAQQEGAQAGPQEGQAQPHQDDTVVDADYEIVDDENK